MSITANAPTDTAAAAGEEQASATRSRKKLVLAVVLLLVLAAGGYWFVLKPGGAEPAAPTPGAVVVLEPVQINLAAGHYLRVGVALQLTADAAPDLDGSRALDATIELFTGRKVADLATSETRNDLRDRLLTTLADDYDEEVMDIYFTEFVTQ